MLSDGGAGPPVEPPPGDTTKSRRILHLSDWLMVAVTVIIAVANFWTVGVMRDQVRVSRDTEARQLRAYIKIEGGDLHGFYESGRPALELKVTNVGLTPASNLTVHAALFTPDSSPAPSKADLAKYLGPGLRDRPNEISLAPNQSWTSHVNSTSFVFPRNTIVSVHNGTNSLVVTGDVSYTDVFGESHDTQYCFIYNGKVGDERGNKQCLLHNTIDQGA